jgi:general secretion pathway protein D
MFLSVALLLAGCATDKTYREGEQLVTEGRTEEGLEKMADAVRENPSKLEYRTALVHTRDEYIDRLLHEGDEAARAGQFDTAETKYRDVLRQHAENPRAQDGLASLDALRSNRARFVAAQAAFVAGELDEAGNVLRKILAREPDFAEAAALLKKVDDKAGRNRGVEIPQLSAFYRKPVTLEFRDAPIKTLLDTISQQTGLNFVLDKEVRSDQRATVFTRDTPLADVLDMVLASSQLAKKVMNGYTLLIYPNTAAKQEEYKDSVVRGFFLVNADPKQTMNLLRTIGRIRDVHVDEKLNMVVVRDTPEAVRLAEKLVKMADRAEPEVMLEVEVLEVARSKLLELGVQWPTSLSVLSKERVDTSTTTSTSTTVSSSYNDVPATLSLLKGLNSSGILMGNLPSVNANKTDGDVNLLANPRIRVRNREKAQIHIGDKVPVITSNVTSTGVTSESVSYLEVGLKLDVEPQVYLDSQVAIKVGMEVSNIVQQVKSAAGTLTYQLGSRNASTVLRLKDGETQVLAGLISDEERSSASKVPGLGDLPVIGHLFSNHNNNGNKTEIVLLITPHIIRNVIRPDLSDEEFYAGSDGPVSEFSSPVRQPVSAPMPTSQPIESVLIKAPVDTQDNPAQ